MDQTINGMPVFTTKRSRATAPAASRKGIIKVEGESKQTHSYKNAKPDVFNNPNHQAKQEMFIVPGHQNMARGHLQQQTDMMQGKKECCPR